MTVTETTYEHVVLDEQGTAWIEGTTMKIIELVLDVQTYGWSPEEAQYQHPHLSLGQVYSALAYYWDNQRMLDAEINKRLKMVEQLQHLTPPSRFHGQRGKVRD